MFSTEKTFHIFHFTFLWHSQVAGNNATTTDEPEEAKSSRMVLLTWRMAVKQLNNAAKRPTHAHSHADTHTRGHIE